MRKKLLLIGGGGHCRSVLDSVLNTGTYDEIGIIDTADCSCSGVRVVGKDEDIPELIRSGWTDAFITVGSVGDTRLRRRLYSMVRELGMHVPAVIDPTAAIARETVIRDGVFVGKHAVINTGSVIGECAIINTGAIIEHDCRIGGFVHVSPGTVLCGQVRIGADSHIGAGSVARQMITVGEHAMIGAGSVVVRNIPDHVKAYGNPCKVAEEWAY